MKNSYLLAIFSILLLCSFKPAKNAKVSSPDGNIKIEVGTANDGEPMYQVLVHNNPFILPSSLGFDEKSSMNLHNGFKVNKVSKDSKDEVWSQPWGENKKIRNNYNELTIDLKNKDNVKLRLIFRAFNDGIGFRYQYDTPARDSLFITDERTMFNFANEADSWSIPANNETYELLYRNMPLSQVPDANTPITFKTDNGVYASVHEAALTDFPEMTLKHTTGTSFKAQLAPWPDGIKARFKGGKFTSPWRTVQIADKAVGLINSGLILNLNDPCALEGDLSWIKPMRYVGVWWGMHLGVETWKMDDRHGATTENAKKYIDFAAQNGIEGVLFEGWNEGWESWGGMQNFDFTKAYADFDINEIVRYAKSKGVEVIGHHETGGNVFNYERQLEHAYKWTADLGIGSVKTGYAGGLPGGLNHHGQFNVRHYRHVVQVAAKNHITIDAHEPIKDTGIRRTYPNMMTREGARGMEWNAWSEGNPPYHHEILPFTRLLGGPMDYTPGTFDILFKGTRNSPRFKKWNDQDKGNSRVNTTLAKQLANWVIIYSPLQMASDLIENYQHHPAFQFFRDFDADCDWSEALQGEPGKFIAVVRKAKDRYFLGASTNDDARTLTIPLNFLENGKKYRAIIYADAPDADWKTNPQAYMITEKTVTASDSMQVVMAAGGGQAITFLPEK